MNWNYAPLGLKVFKIPLWKFLFSLHHHSKEFVKKGKQERVDYDFYAFWEGVEREIDNVFDKKDRQETTSPYF